MSMLISGIDGNLLTFSQFILGESVRPVRVDYGLDQKDKKIGKMYTDVYTFFEFDGLHYVVAVIRDGNAHDVSFGASEKFSKIPDSYTDDPITTRSALGVLSRVLYVLIQLLKDITGVVQFESADPKLGSVYNRLVQNKYFLEDMRNIGFKYIGKIDDKHRFKRG